jgi:hypothetical protein
MLPHATPNTDHMNKLRRALPWWVYDPNVLTRNYRRSRDMNPTHRNTTHMLAAIWIITGMDWPRKLLQHRKEQRRL